MLRPMSRASIGTRTVEAIWPLCSTAPTEPGISFSNEAKKFQRTGRIDLSKEFYLYDVGLYPEDFTVIARYDGTDDPPVVERVAEVDHNPFSGKRLLFYRASDGLAVTGVVDTAGGFTTTRNVGPFTQGWTQIVGNALA